MKVRNINYAAVVLLAWLLSASISYGQVNRSSISGCVFDPDRRPVAQVYVELRSEFSTIGRIRTDGSGRFLFTGLAHGRYTIRVIPVGTGLVEQSEDVEIAGTGIRGQSVTDFVQKDIYLKARRETEQMPFQNSVVYAQEVPKEAEAYYKRGVDDLNNNRIQSGTEALEKAVATFPEYFMALQKLGVVRISQEKYEEAIDAFDRALRINGRCFDCWYGVSYASYTIRKFKEARMAVEKALEERPNSMEASLLLGMCLRMTGDFLKSEQALKRATKMTGDSLADVHWHLALLYGKDLNRFGDAARELEAYLKMVPDAPNKEDIKKLIKQFKDKDKANSKVSG